MTKNAAVNFGYHCHSLAQIYNGKEIMETVAVIVKVDCRVFCHINCLGDKLSNTAAPIQPNPFWFWEKYRFKKLEMKGTVHTSCVWLKTFKQTNKTDS